MERSDEETLSLDSRPVRKLGNSVGQTFDKSAMRKLGIVDDDGEMLEKVEATQIVYSDGRVVIDIEVDD